VIIDLTRKPLFVFPEECPSSVVVRSIGNRTVSGLVCFWSAYGAGSRKLVDITPDAKLTRGDVTCYETKLPLPKMDGLPAEPYECPSVWKDMLTDLQGSWRFNIRIEYLKKVKKAPWTVSIIDGLHEAIVLSTVAVSSLESNPLIADVMPLKRVIAQKVQPGNAWTRILDDDSE
jgi:hypothetical protein